MNLLRIAVIGAGAYETSRSRGYQAVIKQLTDLYTFCAICDRNAEACRAAAETYDIPAQYTDVEEMLQSEKPDVVFCLTPTDSLNVMAMTVAKHRINVITEIPSPSRCQSQTLSRRRAVKTRSNTKSLKMSGTGPMNS